MTADRRSTSRSAARPGGRASGRGRVVPGALLVVAVTIAAACSGGEAGAPDEVGDDRDGANPGPLPTLLGGVELADIDPVSLLIGDGLAFGTPLPSEQAAADAFTGGSEIRSATARRVYETAAARRLADVLVLSLDGAQLFDEGVLRAFQDGIVAALSEGEVGSLELVGRRTLRASGGGGPVVAFREGSALVVVSGTSEPDVVLVVTRMLEARARGEAGTGEPRTPLVAVSAEAAFVPAPTIAFEPFSAPEEEPPPDSPSMSGASAVAGRYGVVAGERRTVVWSIAVDTGVHPTAEAVEPAIRELVSARADGVEATSGELLDRVVWTSSGATGEPSAQAFRHQGLVLLVEGSDPAQLDAVTSAWINALGTPP